MKMGKKSLTNTFLIDAEVYVDAMHYLSNCGSPFDESKFKELDRMLAKVDCDFGPAKRAEMMDIHQPDFLKVGLMEGLIGGFEIINKALMNLALSRSKYSQKSTTKKMMKILNKYK